MHLREITTLVKYSPSRNVLSLTLMYSLYVYTPPLTQLFRAKTFLCCAEPRLLSILCHLMGRRTNGWNSRWKTMRTSVLDVFNGISFVCVCACVYTYVRQLPNKTHTNGRFIYGSRAKARNVVGVVIVFVVCERNGMMMHKRCPGVIRYRHPANRRRNVFWEFLAEESSGFAHISTERSRGSRLARMARIQFKHFTVR